MPLPFKRPFHNKLRLPLQRVRLLETNLTRYFARKGSNKAVKRWKIRLNLWINPEPNLHLCWVRLTYPSTVLSFEKIFSFELIKNGTCLGGVGKQDAPFHKICPKKHTHTQLTKLDPDIYLHGIFHIVWHISILEMNI